MPAIFTLYERKLRSTHTELMKSVADELPCLVSGTIMVPMFADEEKGFESIDECLPQIHKFLCWNHVINSDKMWLKSHSV